MVQSYLQDSNGERSSIHNELKSDGICRAVSKVGHIILEGKEHGWQGAGEERSAKQRGAEAATGRARFKDKKGKSNQKFHYFADQHNGCIIKVRAVAAALLAGKRKCRSKNTHESTRGNLRGTARRH